MATPPRDQPPAHRPPPPPGRRALPSAAEAAAILSAKRTLPPRRGAPPAARPLRALLKPLEGRFGKAGGSMAALRARWAEVAGERLAARTEPVKLTRGRGGAAGALEIRVDGPAAALVQHQAADILHRANLVLGPGAAQRLRIVQGPVRKAAPASRPRIAPPLDAAQEAALGRSLEGMPENRLKGALLQLGREVLRRPGG